MTKARHASVARTRSTQWTRKNMMMDQRKLDRAKTVLRVSTDTDAVDAALDMVAFQGEVFTGIDRLIKAGGLEDPFGKR